MQIEHKRINFSILVFKLVKFKIEHSFCFVYDSMMIGTQYHNVSGVIICRFCKVVNMMCFGNIYAIHNCSCSSTHLTSIMIEFFEWRLNLIVKNSSCSSSGFSNNLSLWILLIYNSLYFFFRKLCNDFALCFRYFRCNIYLVALRKKSLK